MYPGKLPGDNGFMTANEESLRERTATVLWAGSVEDLWEAASPADRDHLEQAVTRTAGRLADRFMDEAS